MLTMQPSQGQVAVDYSQNFYTIKANSDAHFATVRQQLLSQGVTSMAGTGYTPYLRWLHKWEPLVYPTGSFPEAIEAQHELAKAKANQGLPDPKINSNWEELGPVSAPTNSSPDYNATGR
jgi:hypothetical protein